MKGLIDENSTEESSSSSESDDESVASLDPATPKQKSSSRVKLPAVKAQPLPQGSRESNVNAPRGNKTDGDNGGDKGSPRQRRLPPHRSSRAKVPANDSTSAAWSKGSESRNGQPRANKPKPRHHNRDRPRARTQTRSHPDNEHSIRQSASGDAGGAEGDAAKNGAVRRSLRKRDIGSRQEVKKKTASTTQLNEKSGKEVGTCATPNTEGDEDVENENEDTSDVHKETNGFWIQVQKAERLIVMDSTSLNSVYVQIRAGSSFLLKTRPRKKTNNPVWMEKFFVPLLAEDLMFSHINFEIFDKNRSKQLNFLGSATIQTSEIGNGDKKNVHMLPLTSHISDGILRTRLERAMKKSKSSDALGVFFASIWLGKGIAMQHEDDGKAKKRKAGGDVGHADEEILLDGEGEPDVEIFSAVRERITNMVQNESVLLSEWHKLDFSGIGLCSFRALTQYSAKYYSEMHSQALLTRVVTYFQQKDNPSVQHLLTPRSWVEFKHFDQIIASAYFYERFFRALKQVGNDKDSVKSTLSQWEFRFCLQQSGVRVGEQEASDWYSILQVMGAGNPARGVDPSKAVTSHVDLDQAITTVAGKQFALLGIENPLNVGNAPIIQPAAAGKEASDALGRRRRSVRRTSMKQRVYSRPEGD